jgi:hypothetical protein
VSVIHSNNLESYLTNVHLQFFLPKALDLYVTNNNLCASQIGRLNIQPPVFQGTHHKVVLPMFTVKLEEDVAPLLYCATW